VEVLREKTRVNAKQPFISSEKAPSSFSQERDQGVVKTDLQKTPVKLKELVGCVTELLKALVSCIVALGVFVVFVVIVMRLPQAGLKDVLPMIATLLTLVVGSISRNALIKPPKKPKGK
jgi:hypothetical protein